MPTCKAAHPLCARLKVTFLTHHHRETASWDVRTKNVTFENVPTLENVRGIAIYGPGATLFTLGRNNTCQQFDLNSPPILVANVQHPANLLPPSPPVSIEEQKKGLASNSGAHDVPPSVEVVSESDEDHMSPLARIAREMDKLEERQQYAPDRSATISPASSAASSTSRSSAGSAPRHPTYRPRPGHGSVRSSNLSEHTLMSPGSSIHTRQPSVSSRDTYSQSSLSSSSQYSGRSGRSNGRSSRLRQEVLRSPEEKVVIDLFKFTKSRLSDIPYSQPQVLNHKNMGPDELRRQMLSTIFGWHGEVDDLIRDELNRHPMGSPNRLLLTKWLGDIDTDIMATSSESMTASDWMLLALSGIGGQTSQQKVARAYVQRLLEKGDVHTAATIMIGMGDQNDAIEIYVSHKRYMEALILTCMIYPADWGRQTQLLRKWGEWAVQHSQQQLAIRCFSCTGADSTEPFPTPSAQQITFSPLSSSIPEMLSPPLSPPGVVPRGPQRSMAKTAALKLVTTFGDLPGKSKFFGPDDDRTPMAGVGTPIADSALSPGGDHSRFHGGQRSFINTPASARTATPGGFQRQRLPSIGEMPAEERTPIIKMPMITIPTPRDQTANDVIANAMAHQRKSSHPETLQLNPSVYQGGNRAATASPMMQRAAAARAANPLPSPSPDNFSREKQDARTRNGSRGRKPDGLQIHWPPLESIITGDYMTSAELSANSNVSARRAPPAAHSIAGSVSSVSTGGRSYKSYGTAGTASPMTGRSLDPFISSLDSAGHYAKAKAKQERQASRDRDRHARGRSSSKTRRNREPSLDRGRSGMRYIKPAKRSPTSPVPMSPDDLRELGAIGFGDEPIDDPFSVDNYKPRARDGSQATARPGSKNTSRVRRMSPEPLKYPDSRPGSRMANKKSSRRASPNPSESSRGGRGRSKARDGSVMRSPSSPVPMSTEITNYRRDEEDELRRAELDKEQFRHRNRSTSRMRDKTSSSRRSSPGRKHRDRSTSRAPTGRSNTKPEDDQRRRARNTSHTRSVSDLKTGDITQMKTERQLKRENAARELEERRRSLARRPAGAEVLHPSQLSPPLSRPVSRSELLRAQTYPSPREIPTRSQTVSPESQMLAPSFYRDPISRSQSTVHEKREMAPSPQIGLPATPKAMQHPRYDPEGKDIPDVPMIPESYTPIPQVSMGSLNEIAYNNAFENLAPLPQTTFAPLPKTTYQQAPRHVPPRSMSAPIPEEPMGGNRTVPAGLPAHPGFKSSLPPSTRRGTADYRVSISSSHQMTPVKEVASPAKDVPNFASQNNNAFSNNSMGMGGIDEALQASNQQFLQLQQSQSRNDSQMMPPPPPPAPLPPMLPQLQHLAKPPPPPPAPLYRGYSASNADTNSLVSGVSLGSSSGVIEIVMDDDNESKDGGSTQPSPTEQRHIQHQSIPVPPPQGQFSQSAHQSMQPPPPPMLGNQVYGQTQHAMSLSQLPQHQSPHMQQGGFQQPPQQHQMLGQTVYNSGSHQSSHSLQIPPPPPPPPAPPREGRGSLDGLGLEKSKPPPVSLNTSGHSRGRSFSGATDNSLSGRLSRATERMRSASRGRNTASPQIVRQKTPMEQSYSQQQSQQQQGSGHSPYESVPQQTQWGHGVDANGMVMLPGMTPSGQRERTLQGGVVVERHPREIAQAMMEGGMI